MYACIRVRVYVCLCAVKKLFGFASQLGVPRKDVREACTMIIQVLLNKLNTKDSVGCSFFYFLFSFILLYLTFAIDVVFAVVVILVNFFFL